MRTRSSYNRLGLGTTDIVASLAVLSIIGFGAFGLYHNGIDQLRVSTERTIAVRALENEVERLRALPLSEMETQVDAAYRVSMPELEGLRDAAMSIEVDAYEESTEARVITARVRWHSHAGRIISEELTALRAY